ncbi:endonuclease, partial [Streptomyces scopuliridis]
RQRRPSALRSHAPDAARPALRADGATLKTGPSDTDAARGRLALSEAALLSSLVAGTPVPEGFDPRRLRVQSRALAAKRAGVVAKVAPELPEILGKGFRPAFLAYAGHTPMRAGYRRDALDFAESLLIEGRPEDSAARRRLTLWWRERAAARPPRRATRLVRVARAALIGR